jgi:hypothetical protein
MTSEHQKLNITIAQGYIKRNFNFLLKKKLALKMYDKKMSQILRAMLILKSSNRLLTQIEIEHDLNSLGYESEEILSAVLAKYGLNERHSRDDRVEWSKDRMDRFRLEIEKERHELNDLFQINMNINQRFFEKKLRQEMCQQLFVSKDRFHKFDMKLKRLKKSLKQIQLKKEKFLHLKLNFK